jgi:hypothetical protein
MTEIPHLIREKVKDYLNAIYLSEWRSRMDIICDEYAKNIYIFRTNTWYMFMNYNYRHYNTAYKWINDDIYNRKCQKVGKLSPNY